MNTKTRIINYYKECEEKGYRPTVREVQKHLGLSSTSVVQYHLGKTSYKFVSRLSDDNRRRIVELLGGKCCQCGFSDYRALQIDHINGKGYNERKSMGQREMYKKILDELESGVFSNYQLLCANCNWIKRHENNELKRYKPIS